MSRTSLRTSALASVTLLSLTACLGSQVVGGSPSNAAGHETSPPAAAPVAGAVQLPADYNPARSLAPLIEQLSPAVVYIQVESKVEVPTSQLPDGWGPFFGLPDSGQQGGGQGDGGSSRYRTRQGSGSGFIIGEDGYVLTNNHVVDDADTVTVTLADEREFTATVVGTDPRTDVALVHIDTDEPLPTVPLGDSDGLRVGDWVVAIGNPFGLTHTVTTGIVSAKGRVIGAGPYDDFIQTDASINPGNSGGPLFDLSGRVVGINTAISAMGQGIGFAVPIDQVEEILDELRADGKVARGWIGVGLQELEGPLVEQLGASEGVVVSAVYPGNPAADAGLQAGDVVTTIDGAKVTESAALVRAIGMKKPGEAIKLGVLREGKDRIVKVTLGERPEEDSLKARRFGNTSPDPGADTGLDAWGFRVEKRPGVGKEPGGIVVSAVVGDSPADGRLQAGDRILEINRRPIKSEGDVAAALGRANGGAMLVVDRDGTEQLVVLPAPRE
ncbi:MAG: Do family serine endopeptidase [Alphaproteobacteria bacterium]|nr:Do family serine endopeptidase [Alphaproteobacteria bacterium]